jgi:hypothetical protein
VTALDFEKVWPGTIFKEKMGKIILYIEYTGCCGTNCVTAVVYSIFDRTQLHQVGSLSFFFFKAVTARDGL